ncbi:acyl carrier protein (ACP) [Geobacillus kaustophilus HTA426]|uniref:Acyl carrier protein (ACP) n=1 Tax=Geobacillus kaustophilus (strain HTA426) TaxID=235909 RepID=Q5KZX7_GEOKA|nr:acyl carrier protein (ACP) [Geobacillus kaustophilus HTA426]
MPVEQVTAESSFQNDLGVDSLQLVHLLVVLAEKLQLEIGQIPHDLDFRTVGGLYKSLVGKGEII